tara:strand:- start:71 stop:250 length:180 start_codon:yes stop_codon:yes gene_type:complete
MITDYKILMINFGSFIFSFTNTDIFLRITLLVVTILYTLQKWYLLNKNKNKKNNNKDKK